MAFRHCTPAKKARFDAWFEGKTTFGTVQPNLLWSNSILYSYGEHHVLAMFVDKSRIDTPHPKVIAVNESKSTNTTNRHVSILMDYLRMKREEGHDFQVVHHMSPKIDKLTTYGAWFREEVFFIGNEIMELVNEYNNPRKKALSRYKLNNLESRVLDLKLLFPVLWAGLDRSHSESIHDKGITDKESLLVDLVWNCGNGTREWKTFESNYRMYAKAWECREEELYKDFNPKRTPSDFVKNIERNP